MSNFIHQRPRYFGETPKRTIAKFGTTKLETFGYFPLADRMALSLAVLELLIYESSIFRFCTFWGTNTQTDFGDGRPIFSKFQDIITQSSTQSKFRCGYEKLHRFKMVAVQSCLWLIKTAQMVQNFAVFKPL